MGVDADVEAAAAHAQGVFEGQAGGGFGERAHGVVGDGQVVALIRGERLAEVLRDEGEEGGAGEGRRRGPGGERQAAGLGDDPAIVLGAEGAEVVERRRGDGRPFGPGLGRLVRALRERPLDALPVPGDHDIGQVVRS